MQQRYFRKKSWESSWQLYDRMKRESKSDVVMLVPADFLDGVFLRLCWHDKRRAIDETVFAIAVFFFFFYQKFNISEKFSVSSNMLHFINKKCISEMWSFDFGEIWYSLIHWLACAEYDRGIFKKMILKKKYILYYYIIIISLS